MTGLRIFLLAISGLLFSSVHADGVTPGDEISKLYTVNESFDALGVDLAGENVDLNSGQLSFRQVDVSIPGNNGLPVEFARTFSPDGFSFYETGNAEFGDWRIDVPKITTVLTTQHGWPENRCNAMTLPPDVGSDGLTGPAFFAWEYWHGYHVQLPGKGSQELLNRASGNTLSPTGVASEFPVVTNNHWMVECRDINGIDANGDPVNTPGEGFVLHTTDGLTYYFDHLHAEDMPLLGDVSAKLFVARARYVMLASRMEDQFGNWVSFTYGANGNLTAVNSNDGRAISIAYNASGKVASVTANSKTWTYSYVSDGSQHLHLDEVMLPDSRKWQFNLAGMADQTLDVTNPLGCGGPGVASGNASGSITHPLGATISFSIGPVKHGRANIIRDCRRKTAESPYEIHIPKAYYAQALKSKTISGPNLASMTWTYTYSQTPGWYSDETPGATRKWVDVVDPDDGKVRYWYDINPDWREGNLDMTDYYLNASDASYYRRATNYYDLRNMDAGYSSQFRSNRARAKAIIRTERQLTTEAGAQFNWEVLSFDAYDNPLIRREYNNAGRELKKQYTYENRVADWWLGQLKSVEILAPMDVAGLKPYEATFRTDGRIGTVTRFGRQIGTYTYHASGLLHRIIDPLGNETILNNYHRGKPRDIIFPEGGGLDLVVNGDGTVASSTNSRNYTTSYGYDDIGRLESITYPINDIRVWDSTNFTLTSSGAVPAGLAAGTHRRIKTTGTSIETNYYDGLLRPVLTQRGTSYVRRVFDAAGRAVFESYPSTNPQESKGTHSVYDGLGRLTRITRDTENGAQVTETVQYANGNQRIVTNARGKATTYTYRNISAPSNELLVRIDAPETQTTVINRDGLGAMTSVTRSGIYSGAPVSLTREYVYNAMRDLCLVADPETGLTVMHYDARGLVDWQASGVANTSRDCATVTTGVPLGEKTVFHYDDKGRLWKTDYPGTADDVVKVFDTEDNVTSLANGAVSWTYGYNGRNLLESESLAIDGLSFVINPAHNDRGQVYQVGYPGPTQIVAFAPDAFGRPTRVGSAVTDVAYHPNDAVASYTYGNGAVMQMTPNTRGLPAEMDYPGINTWAYLYDANGNITDINHLGPSNAPIEDRTNFVYDGLDRLRALDAPYLWGQSRFEYDALDNLRYKKKGATTQYYDYDASNRLTTIRATAGGTVLHDLDYDVRGNITARNSSLRSDDIYTFDHANRMTSSDLGGDYIYDGHGRRVKTTAPDGEVTYTVYSMAGQLLQEYKPAINKRTDYLYLGGKLVAEEDTLSVTPAAAGSIGIAAGDGIDGAYTLSWPAITGATRYRLVEQRADGGWNIIQDSVATSKAISGKVGGTYAYRVSGCITEGCGVPGSVLSVGVAPSVPTLTLPVGTQNGSYTVSWTKPTGATYYDLEEYKNGAWTTAANDTTTTSKLRPHAGGSYQYRVRAYNAHGTRGYTATSAVVNVLPPVPASISTNDSTAVDSVFTISWGASAGASNYTLQKRKQNTDGSWGTWSTHATVTGTSRTFAYHELADGAYQFQVRANTTGVGSSSWRGTTSVTVEHTPPTPTLSAPSTTMSNSFTVSWTTSTGVVNHQLDKSDLVGNEWSAWLTYNVAGTSKLFLESDGWYRFRIRACKSFVCSAYSAIKNVEVGIGGTCSTTNDGSLMIAAPEGESSGGTTSPDPSTDDTISSRGEMGAQALPPPPGC